MIIGNVVIQNKKDIKLNYLNVVSDISEVNNGYPILIVGYDELKGKYELDFVNRKLSENLFWTLTKTEDRTMYSRDLYDFVMHCEKEYFNEFKYYHINPYKIKVKTLKKFINTFKNNKTN